MSPAIPDRWLDYTRYGSVLAGIFVPLKVPLGRNNHGVPRHQQFTPFDVLKKLPIGLIIDLTNTTRYYDPRDFTSRCVYHEKIALPGRVLPRIQMVERFNDIVNQYLKSPESRGKLIGVHCTHGLNRTGYLVCAYLILELGYPPSEAIHLFNSKRGHKMERFNYLQSLRAMRSSNVRISNDWRIPQKPMPIANRRHTGTTEDHRNRRGTPEQQRSYPTNSRSFPE